MSARKRRRRTLAIGDVGEADCLSMVAVSEKPDLADTEWAGPIVEEPPLATFDSTMFGMWGRRAPGTTGG